MEERGWQGAEESPPIIARAPDRAHLRRRSRSRWPPKRRSGRGSTPPPRAPVAAYVALLGLMVAQGAGRATVLRDRASVLVAAGAAVFMASDLTLALTTFAKAGDGVAQATLPTYYLAQALIAFFILPRERVDG